MKAREILAKLKGLSRPQIAAIYKRYGSGGDVYGVLTSQVAKLAKPIKVDHALALELWRSGNAEARILALLIADPDRLTSAEAEGMARDDHAHFYCSYLSELVARSPIALQKMEAWMNSPQEFVREAGYGVLCFRLKKAPGTIDESEAERMLGVIEKEIHGAPNFARYAMNGALTAIGIHKPSLREKALQAAKRIGKVEVDHGETNCKTPDAAAAIAKGSKRKRCP